MQSSNFMNRFEGQILYGRHAVLEGIETNREIEKVFILQTSQPSENLAHIRRLAESRGIPVVFVPKEKLEKLCKSREHQGAAALLSFHEYASFQEILQEAKTGKKGVLALDHLEDPQNLGSLLRTCEATRVVSGIVIPKRRSAGLSPGTAKASAGAIHHVKTARVPNLHQALLQFRKEEFFIVGADQNAPTSFRDLHYPAPLVLVLGNEHKGISFLVKNCCDALVKIPMRGRLDSLNVSVAGALILYEIFFQWGKEKEMEGKIPSHKKS
jgi:23S rRNA (guanosine2251-2'-O)-methyltransferase